MIIKFLSEHKLSIEWLSQFKTSKDKALATQLLDQLILVSESVYKEEIDKNLNELQQKLNTKIAVYPVSSPESEDVIGYKPFIGGIAKNNISNSSRISKVGRRQNFGSEYKLGHALEKIQDRLKQNNGLSVIECSPTITQLRTQGIQHIVLVDDICGSGTRIIDYWQKEVPKNIKSLLSLKKMTLWIVVYAL